MSLPSAAVASPSPDRGALRPVVACASALASAVWIAVCAAAPEFIWQGSRIALHHIGRTELFSALLIGLVIAFFVEPLLERLREPLHPGPAHHAEPDVPRSALFAAVASLVFALVSVSLHEAISAYVSGRDAAAAGVESGLEAGIELATSWAMVPAAVTLAWLTIRPAWLRAAMGALAVVSSALTAWLFQWPTLSAVTTTIPCVLILGLGYWAVGRASGRLAFRRCAGIVGTVGAAWLGFSLLFDAVRPLGLQLYDSATFWEDVRFYLGWAAGLALAPWPHPRGWSRALPPPPEHALEAERQQPGH